MAILVVARSAYTLFIFLFSYFILKAYFIALNPAAAQAAVSSSLRAA
jgi:hypothetical protein